MNINSFISKCNAWGKQGKPFVFLIDFEMKNPQVWNHEEALCEHVFTSFYEQAKCKNSSINTQLIKHPVDREHYNKAFNCVHKHLKWGNSFLTNLTFPTPIDTALSLETIFEVASAPYKMLYKNQFVVFSPERFIKMEKGYIYSNPMKGTIDATLKDAEQLILNNNKEMWEHNTIVDLIRNDLSIVSTKIEVLKFRYLQKIKSIQGELIQVSSEIRGTLAPNWKAELGTILIKLLPAGSISGAPKPKTLEIIREAEQQPRGYYTGVFGYFDGEQLDSAVAIRFIEHTEGRLQFRSGGGITINSHEEDEYAELLHKVYIPIK